jgi:hypothetical protein
MGETYLKGVPMIHPLSKRPEGRKMAKRKMTPAEKREKKKRQQEFMTIFISGKQKRVKRPPTIDGIGIEDFIERNADPIWLHQNEMWEYIVTDPLEEE